MTFRELAAQLMSEFDYSENAQMRIQATVEVAGDNPKGWDREKLDRIAASLRGKRDRAEEKHEIEGWHTDEFPNELCRKCRDAGWL